MNEKIETIRKWVEKADHDLGSAEIIYLHIPEYRDTIAFHCQQAVEKYLKAYLIFLDILFERTHNLILLLDLISQKESVSNELYDKTTELAKFAVEIRYPDTAEDLSENDILIAISISKDFREYILARMNMNIEYDGKITN